MIIALVDNLGWVGLEGGKVWEFCGDSLRGTCRCESHSHAWERFDLAPIPTALAVAKVLRDDGHRFSSDMEENDHAGLGLVRSAQLLLRQ